MKIIVFSDSHKDVQTMESIVRKIKPDMLIHLGDHISDAELLGTRFPGIPFEMVKGNCDGELTEDDNRYIQIEKVKLLLTHGANSDGSFVDVSNMADSARSNDVKIVLHGHTHTASIAYKNGVLVFNPGSIRRFTENTVASFGLIEIKGSDFDCIIYTATQSID